MVSFIETLYSETNARAPVLDGGALGAGVFDADEEAGEGEVEDGEGEADAVDGQDAVALLAVEFDPVVRVAGEVAEGPVREHGPREERVGEKDEREADAGRDGRVAVARPRQRRRGLPRAEPHQARHQRRHGRRPHPQHRAEQRNRGHRSHRASCACLCSFYGLASVYSRERERKVEPRQRHLLNCATL